jgi:hypothetical protein
MDTEIEVTSSEESTSDLSENLSEKGGQEGVNETLSTEKEAAPAFTSDYKFKVLDKEYEIDEMYRPLAKDETSYKKVKELFEKAYGLDSVKEKHTKLNEKIKTEYDPIVTQYKTLEQSLSVLDKMIEQGDFDNFLQTVNIPEEKIMQWAVKKAKLMQLTDEERSQYNESVNTRAQKYALEQQMSQFQQMQYNTQVETRSMMLEQELSRPDISTQAQSYDARAGKAGAFRELVIQQALLAHHVEGKDLMPGEAVERTLKLFGNALSESTPSTQGSVGNATKVVTPHQTPTIPNLKGGNSTPVKKNVRSLDDLKKLAKQLAEQE